MAKRLFRTQSVALAIFFWVFSFNAESAVITKIKRSKSLVFIDNGKEAGFAKNQKVCFYDESEQNLGCGRIRKLSSAKGLVKIPRSVAAKLKRGHFARTEEMEALRLNQEKSTFLFSPKLTFHYSVLPAYSYNNFAGLESPDLEKRTLFEHDSEGPSGFSFFSGIELDIRVINLSLGFDLMTLPPDILSIEFEGSNESVQSLYEFSNRFFVDYTFLRYYINLGVGVQAIYHGAQVKLGDTGPLSQNEGSFSELTYSESLLTLGARIPISYEFLLKPVGFFLRVTPIFSFYSINMGSGFDYDSDEREGATSYPFKDQVDKMGTSYSGLEEDIKGALGLKHKIFSLDLSLGLFVAI